MKDIKCSLGLYTLPSAAASATVLVFFFLNSPHLLFNSATLEDAVKGQVAL